MQSTLKALALALLTTAAPLPAQQQPQPVDLAPPNPTTASPETAFAETLGFEEDRTQRMTVPVTIDGQGPYSFIVDTGAERTAISRELANRLELNPGRTAVVHSMTEVSRIDTFVIPELEIGRRTVSDIHAPALARHHLGAEGLLGIDSLQSQRVELDFINQVMTVTPSRRREQRWPSDTIVVSARNRYGHLLLVDATFDGQRIYVIVDTGSQVTVANSALRRRLEARRRLSALHPIRMMSVTGGILEAEYGIAREIRIGGAGIRNLPVAFADVQPFRKLQLTEQPAILLGMDALQLFERVSFDFANRRVRFLAPDTSMRTTDVRMASTNAMGMRWGS
ncbi:retroviral-like aspartic protease family protein [Sphingosinicella terrae]|jgi:predicted aspartyl protease|uniref:retroviral-like aspartic protease family protein n=1 Tax=Sphingosinicella terrae TaxID=2172047 RepID=UPI000E0DBAC3|nr:retroviral-like aspartic protease family protein [Sphingosinicella terrae]